MNLYFRISRFSATSIPGFTPQFSLNPLHEKQVKFLFGESTETVFAFLCGPEQE